VSGGIDRWAEAAREAARQAAEQARLQTVAEARAQELAQALPDAISESNPRSPEDTAQLLTEVSGMAPERQSAFFKRAGAKLATAAGETLPRSVLAAVEAVRGRLELAFPESSERRLRLGEALVRRVGGEPGALSRSAIGAKAASALSRLGATAVSAVPREPLADRLERSRSFGPFDARGSPPPSAEARLAPTMPAQSAGLEPTPEVRPSADMPSAVPFGPGLTAAFTHRETPHHVSSRPDTGPLDRDALAQAFGAAPPSSPTPDTFTPSAHVEAPIVAPPATPMAASAIAFESRSQPLLSAPASSAIRIDGLKWDDSARGLVAESVTTLAETLPGFAQGVARAREVLWTREDPSARVRYGVELADDRFTRILEKVGELQEGAPHVAMARKRGFLARVHATQSGLDDIHQTAQAAGVELGEIARIARGPGVRAALHEVRHIERSALSQEGEFRLLGGRAAVLENASDPAFALAEETGAHVIEAEVAEAAPTEREASDFTDDDLALLGSALDPTKPPPQTLWNENMVIEVATGGREQGAITQEQAQANNDLAVAILLPEGADPLSARLELTPVDLAAVLKRSGLALERVDPNQLVAATRYLNTQQSLESQKERLRLVIDNFQTLDRIGLPPMNREQLMGQLDSHAGVSGKASARLSEAELKAKFNEIASVLNGGGELQTKVGKYNLKLAVDEQGRVTRKECKKPGLFERIGSFVKKVAPVALTALSFFGGPVTAGIARAVQGAISAIRAVRSKSVLGFATAAAGMVAGGVAAVASKTVRIAGTVANRVASVADGVARGLQGVSAVRQGNLISGIANIGGAVASGIGSFAGGVGSRLTNLANSIGDVADTMLKAGTVINAADSYRNAARRVDTAKRALASARASGNREAIAEAETQLAEAEGAMRGALFTGLGSTALMAADVAGSRRTPGPGQGQDRPPASGLEAALRAAGRGLNVAGNVATHDWESAGVNALGAAAALQSGRASRESVPADEAERMAAERLRSILGGRTQGRTLNDISNMADAALSYRQSERADEQAHQGVAQAEHALTVARQSGDIEAIQAAQAQLGQARRAAEGALMGSIGAGDALLGTARGVAEQRRLVQAEDAAVNGLAGAMRLDEQLRDAQSNGQLSPEDRERASLLELGLGFYSTRYEEGLKRAAGDPERMAELNDGFGAFLARAGEGLPMVRLAAAGMTDASTTVLPSAQTAQTSEASLAELKQRGRVVLAHDAEQLREEDARLIQLLAVSQGHYRESPSEVETREAYSQSVGRVSALIDDPMTTEAGLIAAILEKNIALMAFRQARSPNPRQVTPFEVGVDAFFTEVGRRGLALVSLGGTVGIERAQEAGRFNAQSSPWDYATAYMEGVINGITFGAADAFVESYAGENKGAWMSAFDGLRRGGSSLVGLDEVSILADPKANEWQKAEAFAALMARLGMFGAMGISRTRYAQTELRNPFAPRTSPAQPGGIVEPKSPPPAETPLDLRRDAPTVGQPGEFSIIDWTGYPAGAPRPVGPFRILTGAEYEAARQAANRANAALRRQHRDLLKGKEIHEVKPVKFGGSPTDVANKIAVPPAAHDIFTAWWRRVQRSLIVGSE
jgi:hypothetical protein